MLKPLLLATENGFWLVEGDGVCWQATPRGLHGQHVTSVIAREGVILAGTTDGLFRSDDGGQSWRETSMGLEHRHVRWLAFHPDLSDCEFAATEPAGIFVSHDGGERWRSCPEVAALRDVKGWYLPYSPAAGCVRGFTFHGARGYAAVEVGGLLRSDDYGEMWRLAGGSNGNPHPADSPTGGLEQARVEMTAGTLLHPDVHSVLVHPSSPDLVFAATYAGLFRSEDGGTTWAGVGGDCYCRAVWVNSADSAHIVLGPATRHGWHGSIQETRDGGKTWRETAAHLGTPWPDTLVERVAAVGESLFAVLDNGWLLAAPLATLHWARILPEVAGVTAVTAMVD